MKISNKLLLILLCLPMIGFGQDCNFLSNTKLTAGLYSDNSNRCNELFLPISFENYYLESNPSKLNTIKVFMVAQNKTTEHIHISTIRIKKEKNFYSIDIEYHIGVNKFDRKIVSFDSFLSENGVYIYTRFIPQHKTCLSLTSSFSTSEANTRLISVPFKYENCWYTLYMP
tara:strand:+ start:252 stop:764 length:513 start_codon:yes stop_codon:yes gene_type:complete